MKADIFFFIFSVALVVLTILASVVLFYFIKASRSLYLILKKLQEHFKESEEYVADLKERLEGNFIFRLFFPLARRKKHRKTIEGDEKII